MGEARSHLKRLRICYTNARSLLNKRSELSVQIDSTKSDIITVTETWLTQAIDSMELDFEGFTLVRADRTQKRKGGEVALFIRNATPFAIIDKVSHESGTCESVSCRLKCKGQELLIGLVYRSPSYEVNEVLLGSLNTWSQSGRCLILEDFNAPMVDWENLRTESSENSFEQELVDAVTTSALMQHVKEATGYDPDTESSLLDLILTHYEDDVTNHHYMPPLSKSNHSVLTFDFHITVNHEHSSAQSRPNVWKPNIPDIMHSASLVDWTIDPESSNETAWDAFRNLYIKVTTPHIPWTTPRGPRNSPPWFSGEVRILRKKRKVWDRFRLLGNDETKSQYRKVRNTCASTLSKSRKLYEEKIV
ncbi:hypothetical protein MS3_00002423 [Schistosoma haematobium]|uniref:Endonuclease/exonuclease/phosphatase domain-containing protein n=1 Tax=Schistosoma haematobium TaxID=6185 RepID=A0A922S7N9_SCHHA|nr:hypothetical protein MS3_00002423 [Schistosoma haematobium]KAH9596900.1 hypothetical protein MS3_00002423 [Schistosoma haematobium]